MKKNGQIELQQRQAGRQIELGEQIREDEGRPQNKKGKPD
jgi:hypothetical protein